MLLRVHRMKVQQLTGNITTHDRLKWYDFGFFDKHCPFFKDVLVFRHLGRHLVNVVRYQVIWNDSFESLEPEECELAKNNAFAGNALR
jgi:hypothetical protein